MFDIVEQLAKKAAEAKTALEALQYSQAAANTANAWVASNTAVQKQDSQKWPSPKPVMGTFLDPHGDVTAF